MAGGVRILPLSESRDLLVSYLPAALVIKLQEVGLGLLGREDGNGESCVRYVVTSADALWALRALLATESEHSGFDCAGSSTTPDPGVCQAALIIDAVEKAWRADDATLERSLLPILQLRCPDARKIAAHRPSS
ncbi:Fanconi anemia group D2 protein [Cyanidiococcus yangmingshanensis]|uniref:Fanconi anemia group D2 protein n=1 Tax=Cyanidiococcus yangmingshanensis TaxID=2690220 RepID=A0A7J7IHY0_9RHOD|nr:Fanconi anemia group D2 protein [Cyanidiococcus yangmingshanensis]